MLFLPRDPHNVFQHHESQSAGREFPGQFEIDFSVSCNQNIYIFISKVLPSGCGVQPRATAIAWIVLGASGASLVNSLWRSLL